MNRRFIKVVCSGAFFIAAFVVAASTINAQDDPPAATQQALDAFNKGQDEHGKGNYSGAIDLYDQALKLLPEFPEAEYQKGNAYLSMGKTADAENAFRRAIDLRSEWTLPLVALGTLLERRGQYDEAEKLLNKALALDDSSFPAYSALIELKLKTKADPQVLKTYLDKVRSFSSKANPSATVFATQATLENALNDRPAAKKSIERALAIDPVSKSALYQKADIALAENDLVLADQTTTSLSRIDPGSDDLAVLRARVFLANGKTDDAKKLLAGISSPSPAAKRLIDNIAIATEESPAALEKMLETDPKNAAALGRLCTLYRVSDPAKALDYCKRGLDAEPANVNFAVGYGAALVQAKRFDDAVGVLRRLNAVAPDNSTIHANLGTALFELNRYQEAKAEYEWLTTRPSPPPIAYYFLAICHDKLGEYLDAGANYDLFLKTADPVKNKDEIDNVKFRRPAIDKLIKQNGGKSKVKNGD
jgi:tetratricopeptide (TPR) repeat protein